MNNNYMLRLMDIIDNRIDLILNNPYITGIGYGFKRINNKMSNTPTITFLVENKLALSEIHPYYRIPKYVNGVITDVIESGKPSFFKGPSVNANKRPAYAGLSVTNTFNSKTYGTIGACVTDNPDKKNLYILSCSHVLKAGVDSVSNFQEIMSPSTQFDGILPKPGRKDGSYIGQLAAASTFKWADDKKNLLPEMAVDMDAAIAYVGPNTQQTRTNILTPSFKTGPFTSTETLLTMKQDPKHREEIWMMSANSANKKIATVLLSPVSQVVEISPSRFIVAKNQFLVEKSSRGVPFAFGDAGALAITKNTPFSGIGMCIGGTGTQALFTPLSVIFDKLKIDFWKE